MYQVSSAYLAKLISVDKKRRRIRGTVGSVSFTEDDILENSFSFTDIAVKNSDIKLGGVFVGSLKLTFLERIVSLISRGSWKGKELNITIGLYLGRNSSDQEIWEDVPLKPFVISEANHSALGVDISAYDYMSKFDLPIQMTVTSGNLHGMATLACNTCHVDFGMTEQEMGALPNGDSNYMFSLFPNNDIETWRDLISWIAVTVGGFATINRDGELEFRTWKNTEDIEIGINDRFAGGTWSDFSTSYTAVQLTDVATGDPLYYAETTDDGLTMDLGANPLLQYGTDIQREAYCRAILTALQNLKYVPFTSTSLIDPALDLGDIILYSDGIADDAMCCVMRLDFSFRKGATVKGYGKNPALNGARSKTDKAIAAAAKTGGGENSFTYYTYINTQNITLTTSYKRLYRIAFATNEKTTVTLWHEIKWLNDVSGSSQKIEYQYFLDGVEFDYHPIDTIGEDGYHSIPHPWWLQDVTGGEVHYWEVKAKLNSGTATVAIGDLHAILQGQRLAGKVSFDGEISIEEEYEPFMLGRPIIPLTENISHDERYPVLVNASDVVTPYMLGRNIIPLTENMSVTAHAVQYTRITENGDVRITEDGDVRVTEV